MRARAAMERAGGEGAWVKPERTVAADPLVEVLAVSRVFDGVTAALRQQAKNEGLRVTARTSASSGSRSLEFDVFGRAADSGLGPGTFIGRWRLREVPRIYRAAIVVDDIGQDLGPARQLLEMPYALTLSILPGLPHSAAIAEAARADQREVMLHLPMEAESGAAPPPGPGELKIGMGQNEVARIIERDLESVPGARGVNNHEGSRATADPTLMAEVMKMLAARHVYFIDSRTSAQTVALAAARREGLPTFYRSVFLDDTATVAYTLGQLERFRRVIERQGVALAIGHPHPTTLTALRQFLPELEADDIELVPPSELVRLPEVAKLWPAGDKAPRTGEQ